MNIRLINKLNLNIEISICLTNKLNMSQKSFDSIKFKFNSLIHFATPIFKWNLMRNCPFMKF